MGATLFPNAENCSLEELETAMEAAPRKQDYLRIQAIRWILLGFDHASVCERANVHRDTIAEWVKRFNARGIDGLIERPRPGRPRKIPEARAQDWAICLKIRKRRARPTGRAGSSTARFASASTARLATAR